MKPLREKWSEEQMKNQIKAVLFASQNRESHRLKHYSADKLTWLGLESGPNGFTHQHSISSVIQPCSGGTCRLASVTLFQVITDIWTSSAQWAFFTLLKCRPGPFGQSPWILSKCLGWSQEFTGFAGLPPFLCAHGMLWLMFDYRPCSLIALEVWGLNLHPFHS